MERSDALKAAALYRVEAEAVFFEIGIAANKELDNSWFNTNAQDIYKIASPLWKSSKKKKEVPLSNPTQTASTRPTPFGLPPGESFGYVGSYSQVPVTPGPSIPQYHSVVLDEAPEQYEKSMDPLQFTPMAPLDEYGIVPARRRQAQTFTRPSLTPLPVTGYQTGHLYSGSLKNLLQAPPPPELSQIPAEHYHPPEDPHTPRQTPS